LLQSHLGATDQFPSAGNPKHFDVGVRDIVLLQCVDGSMQQVASDIQMVLRNNDGEFLIAKVSVVTAALFDCRLDRLEGLVVRGGIFHGFTSAILGMRC